jgi:hypothetical protein
MAEAKELFQQMQDWDFGRRRNAAEKTLDHVSQAPTQRSQVMKALHDLTDRTFVRLQSAAPPHKH